MSARRFVKYPAYRDSLERIAQTEHFAFRDTHG